MNIYSLVAAQKAAPGQFITLYPKARHTLLPRPISLCAIAEESITLVYGIVGAGTMEFSGYNQGETLRLSIPQGNGFDLDCDDDLNNAHCGKGRQVTLVGGGLGVPPLVALAEQLTKQGDRVRVIVGFREEPYLLEDLITLGVDLRVTTDSGRFGFKGTVMDYIRAYPLNQDYYYACGPKAMLRELSVYCSERGVAVQVSIEERMGCGYGACLGCVCKVQGSYKKVCTDGPVFLGKDVDWYA